MRLIRGYSMKIAFIFILAIIYIVAMLGRYYKKHNNGR